MVTENAYPPLQFVDPEDRRGDRLGVRRDGRDRQAAELRRSTTRTSSWDAMIPAVAEGQYDIGMTGITIRDDRAEQVDFSDPYMRSEMFMLVRADEDRFTDEASFAGARGPADRRPGRHHAVLRRGLRPARRQRGEPADQALRDLRRPRAGAARRRRRPGADRRHRRRGLRRGQSRRLQADRRADGRRGLRLHLPQGLGPRRAGQRRDRRDEGRRHASTR